MKTKTCITGVGIFITGVIKEVFQSCFSVPIETLIVFPGVFTACVFSNKFGGVSTTCWHFLEPPRVEPQCVEPA